MAVSARRGTPLTIEEIRAAGLRLIVAGGVEALSMRKLAAELDVNPMSLYHHVANKTELIRGICVGTVGPLLDLPPDDGAPWQDQLRALAYAYRKLARTLPSLWTYVHNHPEVIELKEGGLWDVLFRILSAAGVPEDRREPTADVLHGFVSGLVLAETIGHIGGAQADEAYETAIAMIIRGLPEH
ncbi:TetR/AcrR family transcriptional regulator [Nonomuraea sp. NPDC003804]|uniref:TetR/AcrR family transcriptional regulator n=1 Tax=Nonomuraea sp. NPDC003804 TaxID=3154547 RepID=UPI0033B2259E